MRFCHTRRDPLHRMMRDAAMPYINLQLSDGEFVCLLRAVQKRTDEVQEAASRGIRDSMDLLNRDPELANWARERSPPELMALRKLNETLNAVHQFYNALLLLEAP